MIVKLPIVIESAAFFVAVQVGVIWNRQMNGLTVLVEWLFVHRYGFEGYWSRAADSVEEAEGIRVAKTEKEASFDNNGLLSRKWTIQNEKFLSCNPTALRLVGHEKRSIQNQDCS
ncbi:hypothetical protein LCM10_14350, partial [Rossellomorea aquimaris]|uniref:hypothetical protein n=1 Tax=Rossellomorea aquimaris TaxID=189382 RepID=UPI001CD6CE20